MRTFDDLHGRRWVATAREEDTPRHHGLWYLLFHAEGEDGRELAMPEVRWQSRVSAQRTLRTMGLWELQRRLHWLIDRATPEGDAPLAAMETQPLLRGTGGEQP